MDWSDRSLSLAFLLDGQGAKSGADNDFFVMLNSHPAKAQTFTAPKSRRNGNWRKIIDTAAPSPLDILEESEGILLSISQKINVEPMAAVVLISASK
jgi:hypothetical protein